MMKAKPQIKTVEGIKCYGYTFLTLEQCENLTTARLLAYYKKKRWLWHTGMCECCGECLTKEDQIRHDAAMVYMDAIKKMLDDRGHVVRPPKLETKRTPDNERKMQCKRWGQRRAREQEAMAAA